MTPLTLVTAPAVPLPLANVDTDQIIPARFMRRSRAEGYGPVLLNDLRATAGHAAQVLDDPNYAGAQVLVARRNFGCGSSREAAVYALADFGFRCIVAPSFGDIFASNCVKNGVLPARVSEADAEELLALLAEGGEITVDLESQTIRRGNRSFDFAIEPVWRTQLLNGWDDIDLTRSNADAIARFVAADATARPWATPRRPG
ncbi:3-isopropylmalate dehydratase small subunit [Alsobacter sp. R-9]